MVTILKSGFHWSAFGNQQGSTFTETKRNGLIHHIRCLITLSDRNGHILDLVYPILTIFLTQSQPILADLITESFARIETGGGGACVCVCVWRQGGEGGGGGEEGGIEGGGGWRWYIFSFFKFKVSYKLVF